MFWRCFAKNKALLIKLELASVAKEVPGLLKPSCFWDPAELYLTAGCGANFVGVFFAVGCCLAAIFLMLDGVSPAICMKRLICSCCSFSIVTVGCLGPLLLEPS